MSETGHPAEGRTEPTQKKRSGKRTARACDECRMRKSKCDGLQPCEACQTTDRYCTFNLSAARSTGSGTRIRILEDRLRRAKAYLNEAQKRTPSLAHVNFDALLGAKEEYAPSEDKAGDGSEDDDPDRGELDSMMGSYGQMTMNNEGELERDFYGAASGLAWIQKAGSYFDESEGEGSHQSDHAEGDESAAVQLFDTPLPNNLSAQRHSPPNHQLPPRETTSKLYSVVFTQVYPLFQFLDEDDFEKATDRMYSQGPENFEQRDQTFLPLFHLVIALGYLFSKEEHDKNGCKTSLALSMRHFTTGRSMVDIAHLRTIPCLQSVLCLILFLISTARMASAQAFLAVACASATRFGLHFRSTHENDLSDKERNVRRRIFWAVLNLDMYVSGILGLPPFIDLTTVDPAIDLTVGAALHEVENGTALPATDGLMLAAAAKHIDLMRLGAKSHRTLYPKPSDPPGSRQQDGAITVRVSELRQVETRFREWVQSLEDILSRADDSLESQAVKYELHMGYYFAQMFVYRPFLHYLVKQDDEVSELQLSCAYTCVQMATRAIEVTIEHQRRGLFCPSSWPSIYTVFIGIVCLVFAYAARKRDQRVPRTKTVIENGIRLLACTACTTDTGSVRCLEILRRLIGRVNHIVDIDLDQICSDTRPCCAIDVTPTRARVPPMNLDEFRVYSPDADVRSSSAASTSQASSSNFLAAGDRRRSLGHDLLMAQSSLPEMGGISQGLVPPSRENLLEDEEMLELPSSGVYGWPQQPSYTTFGHNESLRSQRQDGTIDGTGGTSRMSDTMSSDDVVAFMHMMDADDVKRQNRQKERE